MSHPEVLRRLVPGVLVVAALVVVAVVVAVLVGAEEKMGPVEIVEPPVVVTGPRDVAAGLLTGGRDSLSICLDGAGGASPTSRTEKAVRDALVSALTTAPVAYVDRKVVRGCPDPALLSAVLAGESLDYVERNSIRSRTQVVGDELGPRTSSPHRVLVYVVDAETYAAAFGPEPYTSTGEEFVCDGICQAVTRGLYVPMGVEEGVLEDGFLEVLNLLNESQVRDFLEDELDRPRAQPR